MNLGFVDGDDIRTIRDQVVQGNCVDGTLTVRLLTDRLIVDMKLYTVQHIIVRGGPRHKSQIVLCNSLWQGRTELFRHPLPKFSEYI